MTSAAMTPTSSHHRGSWLSRSERWLDERGKGAWIAAMVLGFVVFWPIGLFLLGYMIWSKRMCSKNWASTGPRRFMQARAHSSETPAYRGFSSSGNMAFDSYKADTLRRLEEEQQAFEKFLQRLREAKDKSEFDSFMDDRAQANANEPETKRDEDGNEVPEGWR